MAHPTNVYHLTSYWDHLSQRHDAPASIVLLARDRRQAPGLVMSQFIYYYSFADNPYDAPLQTYLFTGWDGPATADAANYAGPEPKNVAAPALFPDTHAAPLRDFESNRLNVFNAALKAHPMNGSPEWALRTAAREMGLDRGRIGYDHAIVAGSYQAMGLPVEMVYADRAIRRIRMIKSPREIALMRLAAQANADASLAAVKTVRAGVTHRELRAVFFAEAAKRGNTGVFMQLDTMIPEADTQAFKNGSTFMIDCVSTGFRYFGDYGRTVFVGEPNATLKRASAAISFAWDAIREKLRPGVTYAQIKQFGQDALKKGGYDFDVAFTPHSIGLAHTDEPGVGAGNSFWTKGNLTLEENMTLSVDLPVKQIGMGGSAHLEDITLITKDGAVQINDIGSRTVIV
jgi:Xaa-Pro aminopeptidase